MCAGQVFVLQEPARLKWSMVSSKRILRLPVKKRPIEPPILEFELGYCHPVLFVMARYRLQQFQAEG